MSRDFKKKPIWPALSSGSKRKGRPPFHSLRSFHYERPFLSLAADAAFTETMLRYLGWLPHEWMALTSNEKNGC